MCRDTITWDHKETRGTTISSETLSIGSLASKRRCSSFILECRGNESYFSVRTMPLNVSKDKQPPTALFLYPKAFRDKNARLTSMRSHHLRYLWKRRVGDKRTCVLYKVSNSPTIIIITASPDAEVFFRRCSLNFGCPAGTVQPALRRNAQGPPIQAKERKKTITVNHAMLAPSRFRYHQKPDAHAKSSHPIITGSVQSCLDSC